MIKKKGFTLVELLAVIVILAIIALIATPIILNIIEGARKDAAKASAMGYERAVNLKIMDGELTGKPIEDNEYNINDLDITVSGKAPDEGTVKVEGKEVVEYTLRFGEYTVTKTRDGSVTVTKGNVEMITFTIESQSFTVAKGTILKDVPGLENLKTKEGFIFKNFKIGNEVIDENNYVINETVEITIEWEADKPKAQEVITELVPNETDEKASGSNGTIENLGEYGIRYRGKDPENYVEFNDETWRIIGIVDGYMKIISEPLKDSSGSMLNLTWDNSTTESSYGKSEWTEARLMKLLNPDYLGTGGSLYWNSEKGNCYGSSSHNSAASSNMTIPCDFTSTGLKQEARDMIAEISWKLGGWNDDDITKESMYDYERGTTTWNSSRKTTWQGFVGLMYPSDYGFAASKTCTQTLWSYYNDTCKNNNWLFKNDSKTYWTLTPDSSVSNYAFYVSSSGYVSSIYLYYAYGVRAVVHLKPEVKIISGSGKSTDPYKLSLT